MTCGSHMSIWSIISFLLSLPFFLPYAFSQPHNSGEATHPPTCMPASSSVRPYAFSQPHNSGEATRPPTCMPASSSVRPEVGRQQQFGLNWILRLLRQPAYRVAREAWGPGLGGPSSCPRWCCRRRRQAQASAPGDCRGSVTAGVNFSDCVPSLGRLRKWGAQDLY
jgi:hypothetical protein